MGRIRKPKPVNLICAITYAPGVDVDRVLCLLEELYASLDLKSQEYNFSSFTDYYEEEMGSDLRKFFVSFEKLIDRDKIAEIKLETNLLE